MHKGQKGLTLIELLIVVAILGIIAAVVIPNRGSFMITGRLSAANSELENVKTASLAYYAEEEVWPTSSDQIVAKELIAGNLTGTYTFDLDYGWITGGTGAGWTDNGLAWEAADPADSGHGRWIRAA